MAYDQKLFTLITHVCSFFLSSLPGSFLSLLSLLSLSPVLFIKRAQRRKQARYRELLKEIVENVWEKDIKGKKEEVNKEKEKPDDIDFINLVDSV